MSKGRRWVSLPSPALGILNGLLLLFECLELGYGTVLPITSRELKSLLLISGVIGFGLGTG